MGKQSKNANKTKAKEEEEGKARRPPFEITQDEYTDLAEQVDGLSLDEIKEEWILAARHGDLDVVHAILGSRLFQANLSGVVNCEDEQNGNTALHMAAANGHTSVVEVLFQQKGQCQHVANHAGNTPLHWAAANGHETTVAHLLKEVKDIDVLTKNKFGRSALTEGFSSENTNVVKHLLEHDSAAEERLVQGGQECDPDEFPEGGSDDNNDQTESNNNSNNEKTAIQPQQDDIIHSFDFRILPMKREKNSGGGGGGGDQQQQSTTDNENTRDNDSNLRIRELPIPISQDPFGDSPELDTTGYGIWAASLVMARWMAASSERFDGKRLLELGAGCGVPGMSAAYYSDATEVYVTDLNPTTIDNLKHNIRLNRQHTSPSGKAWEDRLHAGPINWEDPETWPKEKIDFIIGSDLIYQSSIVPILQKVVLGLCQGQGTFLYVVPDTESDIGRDGLAEFIQAMKETKGCELVSDRVAPQEYHANPLSSQDDELCFMHFHELSSAAYRLYEFKIDINNKE